MADNISRSYRSRDPFTRGNAEPAARQPADDPLAELARLIGQSDPVGEYGHRSQQAPETLARDTLPPAPQLDWADQGPAQQSELAEQYYDEEPQFADQRYAEPGEFAEERYDAPPLADPHPSYPRGPALPFEPMVESQYAAPSPQARYQDQQEPPDSFGRQEPAFAADPRDDRYEYDEQEPDGSQAQAYAEDYEDEGSTGRRRGGFVLIAAVLCLAVLGTAGAFAYRTMFGGSVLPTLPPIIKASDGPNKIVPNANASQAGASDQAVTGAASGEKLVSREEQPVNVQPPAPRVVSTIPIFPDPNSSGAANVLANGPSGAPMPPPQTPAMPVQGAVVPPMPAPGAAPMPPPAAMAAGPKKIHTVSIRPDGAPDTAAAPPPAVRTAIQAPAPAPRPMAAPAPRPSAMPAPQAGSNGPLELVPQDGSGQAPPVRTHTALAHTPAPIAPAAAGARGYSVQVTSQRSEAEAQSAFRALRAKFPGQLGGREPTVRRADLGTKGVYYRALVGPFASMEQAAGICSSMKAAGGNCIVQRD
jgi:hypothetical protein